MKIGGEGGGAGGAWEGEGGGEKEDSSQKM